MDYFHGYLHSTYLTVNIDDKHPWCTRMNLGNPVSTPELNLVVPKDSLTKTSVRTVRRTHELYVAGIQCS